MPLKKSRERARAKFLYFTTSKSQKQIAQIVGVSDRMMGIWVRQNNWAQIKKAAFHSPEQEMEHLFAELREINEHIGKRPQGERFSTKEELERKTKIITLIAGPLKDTTESWRNLSPEFDFDAPANTGTTEAVGPTGIKMGGRTPDGRHTWDPETLHRYYTNVAEALFNADRGAYNYCMEKQAKDWLKTWKHLEVKVSFRRHVVSTRLVKWPGFAQSLRYLGGLSV